MHCGLNFSDNEDGVNFSDWGSRDDSDEDEDEDEEDEDDEEYYSPPDIFNPGDDVYQYRRHVYPLNRLANIFGEIEEDSDSNAEEDMDQMVAAPLWDDEAEDDEDESDDYESDEDDEDDSFLDPRSETEILADQQDVDDTDDSIPYVTREGNYYTRMDTSTVDQEDGSGEEGEGEESDGTVRGVLPVRSSRRGRTMVILSDSE
jgi:hypothetical protein